MSQGSSWFPGQSSAVALSRFVPAHEPQPVLPMLRSLHRVRAVAHMQVLEGSKPNRKWTQVRQVQGQWELAPFLGLHEPLRRFPPTLPIENDKLRNLDRRYPWEADDKHRVPGLASKCHDPPESIPVRPCPEPGQSLPALNGDGHHWRNLTGITDKYRTSPTPIRAAEASPSHLQASSTNGTQMDRSRQSSTILLWLLRPRLIRQGDRLCLLSR